jgi:hypothetical protein
MNNLILSRQIIIKTMALDQEYVLLYKVNNQLSNVNSQYRDTISQLDLFNYHVHGNYLSNKERKQNKKDRSTLIRQSVKIGMLKTAARKYELEIVDLKKQLSDKTIELTSYIENLKQLSYGELLKAYENIRSVFNYDNYSPNSANKKFGKYKTNLMQTKSLVRTYSTYNNNNNLMLNQTNISIIPETKFNLYNS